MYNVLILSYAYTFHINYFQKINNTSTYLELLLVITKS